MSVARFFASPAGRLLRLLAGVALIALGVFWAPGWLAALGGLFVLVALLNVCLLAPLFGGPLSGRELARRSA
jgi:membrane protein implicated in regulation of membrane protease activity